MSLAFHAAAPAGQWINDPNGLVKADGFWRLFVQHRADAPHFRATGWARFSSPDLLRWAWDGPVLPPGSAWQYSGSVVATPTGLRAWHTCHADGQEWQVVRDGNAGGDCWGPARPLPALGPAAPNRRDPFVWQAADGWRLLLAEPCDWHGGADTRSRLALYGSADGEAWHQMATIGPWHPAGVMWEVPVLTMIDGHHVLLISTVDRRAGAVDCAVHAFVGQLTDAGFQPHPGCDRAGQRLDLGPDFYAAIPFQGEPLCIAWLSSWATARTMPWNSLAGGPLSLPRRLGLNWDGDRPFVTQSIAAASQFDEPAAGPPGRATVTANAGDELLISATGDNLRLSLLVDPPQGKVTVVREGLPGLHWHRSHDVSLFRAGTRRVEIYADGPVLEIALPDDGLVTSVAMAPASGPVAVSSRGALLPLVWQRPRQP